MAGVSTDLFIGHRLLLVGRTGNGKSSTGNSILGERQFTPYGSSSSISYDIKMGRGTIEGVPVEVVDGPGLGDTSTDVTEDGQSMIGLVEKALALICNKFDALVLVLKYGVRFTGQEREAVRVIRMVFGNDVLNSYGVIVMTHGDQFDADTEDEEGITFESWCDWQQGEARSLFDECGKRCVMFDNKTKDGDKKQKQNEQLLKIVAGMKENKTPYSQEDFRKAELGRAMLVVLGKLPELSSKTEDVLTKITRRLDTIGKYNEQTSIEELQNKFQEIQTLSAELQGHKSWLQDEDKGTQSVKGLLLKISLTESRIRTLTDIQSHMLEKAELTRGLASQVTQVVPKREPDLRQTHSQSKSYLGSCMWFQLLFVPVIAAYARDKLCLYTAVTF